MAMFQHVISLFVLTLVAKPARAEYECVCNYDVEHAVYSIPNKNQPPIGYMYEFDCKPSLTDHGGHGHYLTIQFEKKIGYIEQTSNTKTQQCQGSPSTDDLIPLTTSHGQGTKHTTLPVITTHTSTDSPVTGPIASLSSTTSTTVPFTTSATSTFIAASTRTTTMATTTIQSNLWHDANLTLSPLRYIGVGYNLLTGNPDGSHGDPGFLLNQQIFQVSESLTEVVYHESDTCSPSLSRNVLLNSGMAYQQMLLDRYQLQDITADLKTAAFTSNPDFMTTVQQFNHATSVVRTNIRSTCKYGNSRLLTNETGTVHITHEFAKQICTLASNMANVEEYYKFIDSWGTHIVTDTAVGTSTVKGYEENIVEIFNEALKHDSDIIRQSGSTLTLDLDTVAKSSLANITLGRLVSSVNQGSALLPVPLHTGLVPVSEALNYTYWEKVLPQLYVEGTCPDFVEETMLAKMQTQLEEAMQQYNVYRRNMSSHSFTTLTGTMPHHISIPLKWPQGSYTLMQPVSGCPLSWSSGSYYQDTEDHNAHNYYSANIANVIKGFFGPNNMEINYCTKGSSSSTGSDMDWPAGNYCIMRHGGSCPTGFSGGNIHWDDEDSNNHNHHSGTLPDGGYGRDTTIFYCCRSDGSSGTPIPLPADQPFVLHQYGSQCQQVYGMSLQQAYIRWDNEDSRNADSSSGVHPLDTGGSRDHLLHFCLYTAKTSGLPVVG